MYPIRASLVCVGDTSMFEKQLALDNEEKKKPHKNIDRSEKSMGPFWNKKNFQVFCCFFYFCFSITEK